MWQPIAASPDIPHGTPVFADTRVFIQSPLD
jgi:hypothetical protein